MVNQINENKGTLIKWAVCILVSVLTLLIPTNEVFTVEIRKFLAITLFGILMFLFEVMQPALIAMCLMISYPLFGVAPLPTALSSMSHGIVFQALCCMLLLEALNNTNLMRRFAAKLIVRVGGSYFGILMGLAIISLVAGILIPTGVVGMLVLGIAYGFCCALDLKPGDKAAVGIMLMGGLGVCEAQNILYSATGIGASVAMVGTAIENFSVGYVEIIKDNIVFLPILFILPFMYSKMFKAENINGEDYFRQQLKEMGPVSAEEKKMSVILILMILYMISTQWTKLDATYGFVGAVLLSYFPALKIADKKVFSKVDLSVPLLIAGCMSIGNVGTAVGAGAAVAGVIMPVLQSAESGLAFVATTWAGGVLANFIMTPMALYTLVAPVMGPIADVLGYAPKIVAYILYHAGNQVIFPYENNSILIMYSFGLIKMRQFVKALGAKMILDAFFVIVIGTLWWSLLGLL